MQQELTTDKFEYVIDARDRIIDVSDSWLAFAVENDSDLSRATVLGKSLWDYVSNAQTRYLYKILVRKVRNQKRYIQIPFRCDSPDRRRYMELQLSLLANNHVRFVSRIIRTELRPVVPLLDAKVSRSDRVLAMCGWCKQVRVDNLRWMEIEHAVMELELFNSEQLPQLTHGICPDCEQRLFFSMQIPPTQAFA